MAVSTDLSEPLDEQYEDSDLSDLPAVVADDEDPQEAGGQQLSSPSTSVDYCGLSGWYWYCREHDAHGIADSEDEATFVLDAHAEYHELQNGKSCADSDMEVVFFPTDD